MSRTPADFHVFGDAVRKRFEELSQHQLYVVDSDKSVMWAKYLDSFPEGTNKIFKERREHDCNLCSQFVKRIGNVVAIVDGHLESVWDVQTEWPFNIVTEEMQDYVENLPIRSIFLHDEKKISTPESKQMLADASIVSWNHFSCVVPNRFIKNNCATLRGKADTTAKLLRRGLTELSAESLETVQDLISDNAIYRGQEFADLVNAFAEMKTKFDKIDNDIQRSIFIWSNVEHFAATFRNTVIGTLATDIADGVDLERAVSSFESKVAPTNYKRSSAVITKGMIKSAMGTINDLGISDSLKRRMATIEDVSINNVLFADRSYSPLMKDGIESLLMEEVAAEPNPKATAVDVTLDKFIDGILPTAKAVSVYLDNKDVSNFVSVIAAEHESDKPIFKWDNAFSWSYNGNVTDSIKERVKQAGGNIDAKLRVSLSWFNRDDLDIHMIEPNKNHVYYGNKCGKLDVDMNAGGKSHATAPVENISINSIQRGTYRVYVNNYTKRETSRVGYEIEVEYEGAVSTFRFDKAVATNKKHNVIEFEVTSGGVNVTKLGPGIIASSAPIEGWGLNTKKFHKVTTAMLSPNYWDGQTVGNKHLFFMLEGCKNPNKARGIYNEFLSQELNQHRKVFEVLADKTKCPVADEQLSGVGYSSTKSDSVLVSVDNRLFNIKI